MVLLRAIASAALLFAAVSGAAAETRVLQVPATTLYPGDPVQPGMLAAKSFTGSTKVLSGYVESGAQVEGKFARRTLVAGKPIALSMLKTEDMVFEGQPAQAVFESGSLSITTLLLPLETGGAGDMIKARNPDSGLTVTATVQADGTLKVSAP